MLNTSSQERQPALVHRSNDARCVMCRDQRAEVNVTWQTSRGPNTADVCEYCAAIAWGKMVPGLSMDTFTISPIPITPTGGDDA